MNEDLQQTIQRTVEARIKSGAVRKRSRAYFVVRVIVILVIALCALTISAYVLSFVAFGMHESGEQFLLGFGLTGVRTLLTLFPWGAIVLDLIVLVVLERLLRGFSFGYRVSLLTLTAVVIMISALAAFALYLTPLHMNLLDAAEHQRLPLLGELYEQIRDSHADKGIFRGTVTAVEGQTVTIEHDDHDHDGDDGSHHVNVPAGTPPPAVGSRVYVFGAPGPDGSINAHGIQPLGDDQ